MGIIATLLIYCVLGALIGMITYILAYFLQFRSTDNGIEQFLAFVESKPFVYVIVSALIWPVYFYWIFFER